MDNRGGRNQNTDYVKQKQLQCTDQASLIAFVLFWCGMIFVTAFASTFGDPWRLVNGVDSFGNVCGRRNTRIYAEINMSGLDLRNMPYLFPMDAVDPFNSLWICVKQCPNKAVTNLSELRDSIDSHICSYDVQKEEIADSPSTSLGPCPTIPVPQSKAFRNRCVPSNLGNLYDNKSIPVLEYIDRSDLLERAAADFMESYVEIMCLCAFAFGLSVSLMIVICFCSSLFAYLVFALVIFGSVSSTISLWCAYFESQTKVADFLKATRSNGTSQPILLASAACNQKLLLIYLVLSTLITMVFIAMCATSWQKIGFVAELFQQSARCMRKLPRLLLQPIWTCLILSLFFTAWTYAASMLATADFINASNRQASWPYDFNLTFVDYDTLTPVKYFCWYYFIGLIWTAEFVLAIEQFVTADGVASWYFFGQTSHSISKSIRRLICYHLGTVALGSLLITLLKVPRSILLWIKARRQKTESNCVKGAVDCCCCGCLWCLDRYVNYVHHNAYVVAGIDGTDLWSSAKLATDLVSQTGPGIDVVMTGGTILFLAKCGVTATTGFVGVLLLKNNPSQQVYALPLSLACVFAYLIAHCFLTICEMIIDTLFLCYCGKDRIKSGFGIGAEARFGDSALNGFMDRICGSRSVPPLTAEEIALREFED